MEDSGNGTKLAQMPNSPAEPQWDKETYALARKMLSRFGNISFEDREDIIQDFALTHPHMEGFGGKSKLPTWLYSCLSNKALDFIRRRDQTRIPEEKRIREISLTPPEGVRELPITTPSEDEKEHSPDIERLVWDHQLIKVWGKDVLGYPILEDEEIQYIEKHLLACNRCQIAAEFAKGQHEVNKVASQIFRYGPMYIPSAPTWGVDPEKLADPNYYWRDVVEYVCPWQYIEDAARGLKPRQERRAGVQMPDNISEFLNEEAEREKKRQALIKDIETQIKTLTEQKNRLMRIEPAARATPKKGQRICQNCLKPGHNSRTCPEPRKAKK